MIMRSVPLTQTAQVNARAIATCTPWAATRGRLRTHRVKGLGQVQPPTGYSGAVATPGGGSAYVNLTTEQLVQGLAVEQGRTYTPGMCDSGGVPGALCAGYLQSFIALIQNGTMVYDPSSGSWSINMANPTPPSAAAAAAYAASASQSPFATPITASTYTGSTVYSQPQAPLAQLLAALGLNSATIVQPTPATQPVGTSTAESNPASAISQASGVTSLTSSTANGTLLPGTSTSGDLIPGIDNTVLFIGAGVAVVLLILVTRK
jgi:hypothetical protein